MCESVSPTTASSKSFISWSICTLYLSVYRDEPSRASASRKKDRT